MRLCPLLLPAVSPGLVYGHHQRHVQGVVGVANNVITFDPDVEFVILYFKTFVFAYFLIKLLMSQCSTVNLLKKLLMNEAKDLEAVSP